MIDLLPSPEQQQIVDMAVSVLRKELPDSRLLSSRGRNLSDREAWPIFVEQGWLALSLSEELGGMGYGKPELVLAHRELGRSLVSPTVLATTLAVVATALAGNEKLSQSLLEGQRIASLGLPTRDGEEIFVIDGKPGDVVLLLDPDAATMIDFDSLACRSVDPVDPSLTLARARPGKESALAKIERSPQFSAIRDLVVGAQLVGIAEATCARSAEYAKTREQFGQPIGSFQAIKHRCADMLVRAEVGWAQVAYASISADHGASLADVIAGKLVASEAAVLNGQDNIQVHGAIGYTAEFDAHLFLKRAEMLSLIGGTNSSRQRQLLDANLR